MTNVLFVWNEILFFIVLWTVIDPRFYYYFNICFTKQDFILAFFTVQHKILNVMLLMLFWDKRNMISTGASQLIRMS